MKKAKWLVALLALALVVGMVALVAVSCEESTTSETDGTDSTTVTTEESTTTTIDNMEDYELVLSVGMPSSASLYKTYLKPWMAAVEEDSNGRITFQAYDNNSLVKEEQQIEACRSGTSDITAFQPTWEAGVFPLLELASQPGVFPTTEVADRVMWDLIEQYGAEEYEDFQVLGIMMIAPAQWGGVVEVRVPDDMQGLRVRSGGAEETETINALGATPVEVATSDIPVQITRGAFDGAFMSWGFHAWMTNKWATTWTETSTFYRPILVVMNKDKFESLPAVLQQTILDNSGIDQSVEYNLMDELYQADNSAVPDITQRGWDRKAVAARAAKLGTEIIQLTAEERAIWNEALAPVIDAAWTNRYAGKIPTQEILDALPGLIAQYYTAGAADDTTDEAAEE